MSSSADTFVGSFVFDVYINGLSDGSASLNVRYSRVSGVATESEELSWMQGSDTSVNTAPGRVKYANVTLERVFEGVDDFYKWRRAIEEGAGITADAGTGYRRDVTIRMYRRNGECIRKMVLEGAWPSRWQLPDLDAGSSNMAVETIVLTVRKVYEEEPNDSDHKGVYTAQST